MKRSIARKWAQALESGEYKQATGQLRKADGAMCCLGVLCNLHAQEHPEIAAQQKKKTVYCGEAEVAPKEVLKWSGLQSDVGILPEEHVINGRSHTELTELNDNAKLTFPEIAKVIRKHWKGL